MYDVSAEVAQAQEILCHDVDGTVVVTLNAPQFRNALSTEMRELLLERLQALTSSADCRAIVVAGAGGHFCSGGRLPPNVAPDPDRSRRNGAFLQEIARILHLGPKPTIAAVEGTAFGAGFAIAMACDRVVAAEGARMCAAFGKVGLVADTGIAYTLSQRIGSHHARDLLLTGREVRGAELIELGLVDRVVPAEDVLSAALAEAGRYAQVAPLSLAATKRMLGQCQSLDAVFAAESAELPPLTMTHDYAEGRTALREKRKPVFRGA